MTVKEAYNYGVYFLSCNGVDEPAFKSLCLVCHLAGIQNSEYHTHESDEIIQKRFADLLWRVKRGEPLQYVLGKWDFYESTFSVGPGVLIPRPETEELVELVLKQAEVLRQPVIYDLCSGSGCIGISLAKKRPDADVFLFEKSAQAFVYLQKNCAGLPNVHPIAADICCFDEKLPAADILVSNPPYIRTADLGALQKEVQAEPMMALDGGENGLDFYSIIHDKWAGRLKAGGMLFLEIGEDQAQAVSTIFQDFKNVRVFQDVYGNDRMISAIKA